MKQKILDFLQNKKITFLTILLIHCLVLYIIVITKNHSRQIESIKTLININSEIVECEKKLNELKKKEENLYPKIEIKNKEYEKIIKQIEKRKGELNEIKKTQIDKDFEKININELNSLFNSYGYTSKIICN